MTKPKLAKPAAMHILFADDEKNLQELMRTELPRMGYSVTVCPDGLTAVAALEKEPFDCLLVDLDMPGMNGIEVIGKARELRPEIEAVVMTGNPSKETAIAALRHQAFDYLTKPCRLADIAGLLGRVNERRQIRKQMAALNQRLRHAEGDSQLVGSGNAMDAVRSLIAKVSPTDSSVLIRGETGCGKELVARAVHNASLRADKPLVPVNCGALPENLIESELFGHCRGAFTGADTARTGLFEVADGGTIFLDEIGELPLSMQAKLLRVLETGDIRRLGDNQTVHVDVRVVCATHRDLEKMVEEGTFREDLMFRINTFEIHVPALRERTEDIPVLARHLLRRHRTDGSDDQLFTPEALDQLLSHQWPGNVRELANVIEHSAILCDSMPIGAEDLPRHFGKRQLRKEIRDSGPMTLRDLEMIAIDQAIQRNDGNKPAAAEELGVSLKTLYNKLNAAEEKKQAG
ncbi:Transcriptional regulatory protein ZraR [Rubripirellula tenax]|uniref:Transcriptional regulatory protein ZraR n=2 Tax=Rubripirellula tenax TaxID=2528015 RepID=A0A5C6EFR7_9BACT|nr:Transcriptional regulatory protein ZraR [Rubripirellula tenax]